MRSKTQSRLMVNSDGEAAKMEHMAEAMASMAETCDTMMQQEMAGYPWKIAAIAVLVLLAAISLALFVVLEILWIRLFYFRITQIKNESRLPPP